ncbi:MAG: DNA polymerase IV [Oscillospiraceae bacterium]|nr:DNA polymerase IV [Oscillospiraceae bacterium]
MDAFYASVEERDDPSLRGRPLIIGSLPQERGVVATANYEARKYGVRSGMNIKDAYRLCPQGIYMHPSFEKYRAVSDALHEIWNSYASASETIALDEAYLDVTETAGSWERAREFARAIKERTRREQGLTCSVGLAYSKTAAKTASEEKKPDGYFEIPTAEDFVSLIRDRDVRVLYTVGEMTAEKLHSAGIMTVRDLESRADLVERLLGKQGRWLVMLSRGIDDRPVTPYRPEEAKSISREVTFQADVEDFGLLRDVLLLLALCVEHRAERVGLLGSGVALKITYADMKGITRQRVTAPLSSALGIYKEAASLLDGVARRPVRLIGAGIYNLDPGLERQLTFEDISPEAAAESRAELDSLLAGLGQRYGLDFAGNLDKLFRLDTLHRTVEYMRKKKT